jgi:hypothetical protein
MLIDLFKPLTSGELRFAIDGESFSPSGLLRDRLRARGRLSGLALGEGGGEPSTAVRLA